MMPSQRACVAESQVRNKLSNGPLRVQSKVYIYLHPVFCNVWAYVSCRGNWFMYDWYDQFADTMIEAYQAGHKYFGDYLDGKRPFLWHHYFELHYFKQFIKRLLGIQR